MNLMTERLVKIGLSTALGFIDAIISHGVEPKIPIYITMIYSVPIEYLFVTPIFIAVKRIARKVMQSQNKRLY